MKKLITVFACLCCMICCASCGNTTDGDTKTGGAVNVSENSAANAGDGVLPDKSNYDELTQEAKNAFDDVVIKYVKQEFPEDKDRVVSGFCGEASVKDEDGKTSYDCYVYDVFSKKDNVYSDLGTYAVVEATGELYKLNKNTNSYSKVELKEEECNWADTERESRAKYLSSNKTQTAESQTQNDGTGSSESAS